MDVDTKRESLRNHTQQRLVPLPVEQNFEKQVCALKRNWIMKGGGGVRVIPVSGLMLFCGCVVGAGLLRECAWTGGPEIGC